MHLVLVSCANAPHLGTSVRSCIHVVSELLEAFAHGKTGGGDSWEALFVIAFLIRLFTREHHPLLCVDSSMLSACGVTYNEL